MKLLRASAAVLVLVFCGRAIAAGPSDEAVENAMKKAASFMRSIATNGGYVGIYSLDLRERYGEAIYEKAGPDEIWVQPPGTPSIGGCYLRAYRITGDADYLEAALDVGKALAWGQRKEGGWDHRVDVSHMRSGVEIPERKSGRCTFDDDITQGAIKYLFDLDKTIDEAWLTDSIGLGMKFMLESQFDNGAWPQWYPLIGGYHDYYTFNDNTINDCIMLMMEAHRLYGNSEYLDSVRKGGDFIILSQLPKPQSGWAQQYSHDLKPAWARKFEPPAVCSAVTSRNIRTLVEIYRYTGDEKYLEPIPAALDWLERSKIGDDLWARMYEVGTNRPIYGDVDGKVHYTLGEISEERRRGYSWQSSYGVPGAAALYRSVKDGGGETSRSDDTKEPTSAERKKRRDLLAPIAGEILGGLDEQGRWVSPEDNRIHARDFVQNFGRLCEYLELGE